MPLLFHAFSTAKYRYVFDANTNSVISVGADQYKALSEIEHGNKTQENLSVLHEFQKKGICKEVFIEKIYNSNADLMVSHLENNIHMLILQVTQGCNLRCDYCGFSGLYNNRVHAPKSMNFETAKRAIDWVLSRSADSPFFSFAFFGGEPLLELPLIKKCVEYIKQQAIDREIILAITTNGTLLTPEVYEYLNKNNFLITISLDGPKEIHDRSRKFPNGNGSYDVIMDNIKSIKTHYPESREKLRFNAVLSPETDDNCLQTLFKSDDVLSYYNHSVSTISETYIDEIPKYSDAFNLNYNHEICKQLLCILGKLEKKNVSVLFDTIESDLNREYSKLKRTTRISSVYHPGGPCFAGAMRLFINVEGKFFPCERVSENSQLMAIGDLDNGFDLDKIRMVMNPGQVTENQCKKCWAITHCTLCAAYSDNLTGLSSTVRLKNCPKVRKRYEDTLKRLCFLKESGYMFETRGVK